jgi:hypothetical protein
MNKIAVVVGMGTNNIEIPLLVFPDIQSAQTYLTNLGLNVSDNYCELPEEKMETSVYIKQTDKYEQIENPIVNGLFKNGRYYDGCGGCDGLEIREVQFGEPLIGWDLD